MERLALDAGDIGPSDPIKWFGAAIGVYLAAYTLGGLTAAYATGPGPDELDAVKRAGIGALALYSWGILWTIVAIGLVRRTIGRGAEPPTPWRGWAIGLGVLVLASPVLLVISDLALVLTALFEPTPPEPIAHQSLILIVEHMTDPWAIAVIIGAVVGAPVLEETIYRGLLQTAIVRALQSRWWGVVLTSTLFALMHRASPEPVPWRAIPSIFAVGMVCGMIRERRSGGLTGAIAFHAGFNAANIGIAMLVVGDAGGS